MSDEVIGVNSAYSIAFSVDHRGPGAGDVSRNAWFSSLFDRIGELLDGDWQENVDAWDSFEYGPDDVDQLTFNDRAADFRAAAYQLIARLQAEAEA